MTAAYTATSRMLKTISTGRNIRFQYIQQSLYLAPQKKANDLFFGGAMVETPKWRVHPLIATFRSGEHNTRYWDRLKRGPSFSDRVIWNFLVVRSGLI